MKTHAVLLLLTLITPLASARVGETPEQLVERYGAIVKEKKDSESEYLTFLKGGVSINCVIRDGKTVAVLYDFFRPPSEDEIKTLLDANSGGKKWKKDTSSVFLASWVREDSVLSAIITRNSPNLLTIALDTMVREEGRKAMYSEKKKLDGF